MKTSIILFVASILVCLPKVENLLTASDTEGGGQKEDDAVTNVIYDTDMCTDVDDVGALAILHKLSDEGLANILAVVYNEVHKRGVAAIDAINTWYGRGDIPIGAYKKTLKDPDYSSYLAAVAKYENDTPSDLSKVPDALDVYVNTLKAQKDNSVTIVSVGFLNNLADLLRAEPELVERKVKKLVVMAGVSGDNFNTVRHDLVGEAQKVLEDWPTLVVISPIGEDIYTGVVLENVEDNPVRTAYYKWFNSSFQGRSSWDLLAVLYAVKGTELFDEQSEGNGSLRNGYTYKMSKEKRIFITGKFSKSYYEALLNTYLIQPPTNTKVENVVCDKPVDSSADCFFDLMGRRVSTPETGLYFVNGKKVLYR